MVIKSINADVNEEGIRKMSNVLILKLYYLKQLRHTDIH